MVLGFTNRDLHKTLKKRMKEKLEQSRHVYPGGTPYNGPYGEAPPKRGTFFRLQVYKRVGISQVVEYKRVGKSVI